MADYLEGYGVEAARRETLIKRIIVVVVALAVIGGGFYLGLRTYPARRQVSQFLDYLRNKDYQSAYRLWGCTESSPCKDYPLERFVADWGPQSPYANAAGAEIVKIPARTCNPGAWATVTTVLAHAVGERGCDCGSGVIHRLKFPNGEEPALWYERRDGSLTSAPWPVCVPQPRAFQ